MQNSIKQIIEEIRPDINPEAQNLLEEIDSFDIVTIIASIEDKFSIKIPAEKILPEYFHDISSIISLINEVKQ
ncbi:phosphopantetheine-binding protein [Helicobacter brantae]|uniref:Acyl carrier protein n=1 Tax=Helicobacter brantae TaxID=375927 RepID=A0A3D8J3U6_9HELI|nr:phosphopantetheine-binding protein [Helicobacter brantae]RDU72149.1 acyl carrier protein [Helicobacter brantae]